MYPCDICEVIAQFKHPLWYTWGVESNRWGARQRESVGLFDAHGTLWFATVITEDGDDLSDHIAEGHEDRRPRARVKFGPIPCNEIPYNPVRTAQRDERRDAALFVGGKLLRGWRPLLSDLAKQGFLRPDERLSALIGEDTWQTVPQHLRL
jgi:hypothetical protein